MLICWIEIPFGQYIYLLNLHKNFLFMISFLLILTYEGNGENRVSNIMLINGSKKYQCNWLYGNRVSNIRWTNGEIISIRSIVREQNILHFVIKWLKKINWIFIQFKNFNCYMNISKYIWAFFLCIWYRIDYIDYFNTIF